MARTTVDMITIAYRGKTQQFTTVSQAVHFLRRDDVRTGWFHKVTADVYIVAAGDAQQTHHLRGQKFDIIKALEQLKSATTQA
jgi:hypothetical protein